MDKMKEHFAQNSKLNSSESTHVNPRAIASKFSVFPGENLARGVAESRGVDQMPSCLTSLTEVVPCFKA